MAGRTVQLRVGGQSYRVTTSASDEELQRLAAAVDAKLAAVVPPGRAVTPQAMLLAAMALAHELEEERTRSASITAKLSGARGAFTRMIARVDAALAPGAEAETAPTLTATPLALGSLTPSPLSLTTSSRPPSALLPSSPPGPSGRPANES
jgi:cell division protein ZapA